MTTVMVSPIHFEDFSGVQFERLVLAYHMRAGWHDLVWHGQSGGERGVISPASSHLTMSLNARPLSNVRIGTL